MATNADPAPTKKPRNSRKALKQKNELVETPPSPVSVKGKSAKSFEQDLMEMQTMLEKMKIEKDKTEELLKEKDEILRKKEEELETRDAEQEKLKVELKKLQKMKEFKPNMTFACGQSSLTQAEQEKANKKKKKDCPETKRPSSSYVLWCKDQWTEVKKENPEADFKETSNILGAKWKSLSAEDKKPYEERYQVEKEAYLQVIAKEKREKEAMKLLEDDQKQRTAMELLDQYLNFVQEAEQDNKKKNKKEKDPLKPKHPVSAFLVYANERRAALREENKSVVEVAKITGEEWKNLSDKKKAPYEKVAKKNKETYLQAMEEYKRTKEEEALSQKKEEEELLKLHKQEALQMLKKKEKTDNLIKKKKNENVDPNKPKKPASSYFLFSKDERKKLTEERPGTNNATVTALISLKWKELSEEEKQVYNGKAAKLMEAYKKEVEAYNKKSAATTSS
ncbi:HMG (high mobility group) box protein [Arabidopsis thaliana]|uniref:HMG (High mobility group) box protein n=1 Tax=Arabidopsis thaliana TaxID=3702 RepID=F4JPC5_ARATH|nr:HMG (high mobility group) box protein [Arabidopsis thaliana]AEE84808.1 HMG (high mobility group) box protein [Arabidopsis thaliana]|eukprot:NP_001190816.1 HMG (high mobility group) box protein [Arabidopsis thaliana]